MAPWFGDAFGLVVGVVFGLLLFSAVNTAVVALIGVIYMMAQDGEMPRQLARLNRHGVPRIPLFVAVAIPILVLAVTPKFEGTRRPLRHRRGRCDRGQSRFLHFQQAARSHLVPTPAHGRDLSHPRGRRVDHRQDETGRALLRHLRPRHRSRASRLLPQALRIKDRHHDEGSRRNGRAQSPRDDAAAARRRAENHGRGARDQSGAEFCARGSAAAQSGALRGLRQGDRGLFRRRAEDCSGARNGRTTRRRRPSCRS